MGVIKYYKKWLEEEQRYQYEERNHSIDDDSMAEITKEEYDAEVAAQWDAYLASLPAEENNESPTYEDLIAKNSALEAENAALLYQVLTGEELTDV